MLLALPSVFDLKDMESILGMSRKDAKQACWRWKTSNFITAAGPQAGIYFNEAKPMPRSERMVYAMDKAIRMPYLAIGGSAINQGGWTTQIFRIPEVAAPYSRHTQTYPKLDEAIICPRPLSWMKIVWSVSSIGVDGLMTAPPEYALIDCIMARNGLFKRSERLWEADPDDISMSGDDELEAIRRCYRAAQELGAPTDMVRAYLERVPDFEDFIDDVDPEDLASSRSKPGI